MRDPCPDCGSRSGYADYGDHTYCHSCTMRVEKEVEEENSYFAVMEDIPVESEIVLPATMNTEFSPSAKKWLLKAGITAEMVRESGIGFVASEYVGDQLVANRVILPIRREDKIIGYTARSVDEANYPKYLHFGKKDMQWKQHPTAAHKAVVLVEDYLSGLRVGKFMDVATLFGTSIKERNILTLCRTYDTIILWLDPDEAGKRAAEKLMKQLTLYANVAIIISKADPKCLFDSEIQNHLAPYLK